MLWLIEEKFFSDNSYRSLVDGLSRLGLPYQFVKPVPFTLQFVEEPTINSAQKVITFGSYTLARIAKDRGWTPGSYTNNMGYGGLTVPDEWLLNGPSDTEIVPFGSVSFTGTRFVRPVEDTKSFAGGLYTTEKFVEWRDRVVTVTTSEDPLNAATLVVVSTPKEILSETRLFIVNNVVVTYSQYKRGGKAHFTQDMVDAEVLDFAKNYCDSLWEKPSLAFVLDVAQTPNGCKIVETNCINAAGLYACDSMKLIQALEDLNQNV